MTIAVRKLLGKLLGMRLISFCRAYIFVPWLLFRELLRVIAMIHYKRRYSNDPEVLLAALRTTAHILDKSLQADDWEMGRGLAQYKTLCKYVERLKDSPLTSDPSFRWALDKKREYEESQQRTPKSGQPYSCSQPGINKNQLLQLIQSRRSTRLFKEKQIEPDILKELADVVSWSATSCNRQPAKLFITQHTEKIGRCLKQCAGATCFGKKMPCFIAVCADTRFYMLKDRNLPFIDISLGLQNMLLMAHLQGIEATILNWMHHTSRENVILRETLGIPEYYLIVLNLILGYPIYSAPIPGRKSSRLALTWVD